MTPTLHGSEARASGDGATPIAAPVLAHESRTLPMPAPTSEQPSAALPGDETPPPVEAPRVPVVRVTIGRVEIRALAPAAAPRRGPAPLPPPRLSLDEYLERRR
jgi:hypothetical protein